MKLGDLERTLRRDVKTLHKRTLRAASKTAELGRLIAYAKAPVAFAELRDGIISEDIENGSRISSTAPYSAAVEVGSRPHMPPVAPIYAWVKLMGIQALDAGPGATGKPAVVSAFIHRQGTAEALPVDAALRVAWAIAFEIKKNGTLPTLFMDRSLPEIEKLLHAYVTSFFDEALPDGEEQKPSKKRGGVPAPASADVPELPVRPRRVGPPRLRDERGKFIKASPKPS